MNGRWTLGLTPHGHLYSVRDEEAPPLEETLADRLIRAFAKGSGPGLLQLGGGEQGLTLPPVLAYWRSFGARYLTQLCTRPDLDAHPRIPPLKTS